MGVGLSPCQLLERSCGGSPDPFDVTCLRVIERTRLRSGEQFRVTLNHVQGGAQVVRQSVEGTQRYGDVLIAPVRRSRTCWQSCGQDR